MNLKNIPKKLGRAGRFALLSIPFLAFAEDGAEPTTISVDRLIDWEALVDALGGELIPILLAAIGLAASIFMVIKGWQIVKKMTNNSTSSGGN